MPAEGDRHERTWLAWPSAGYVLGDTGEQAELARATWGAVAAAVARFEPLSVVVDPRDADTAPGHLPVGTDLHVVPLDDAWARDTGPTFVLSRPEDGPVRLGAVDWTFNGWGGQDWASWERDAELAACIAGFAGAQRIDSPLVNEGGGLHVDGEGTVLLTQTVQLDPGRNPDWSQEAVERELARTLGTTRAIWLPRGLTRDSGRFGTRGHVDLVATFARPGVVLVHDQRDPAHPDHAVSQEVLALLRAETDAAGRPLEVVPVPAPRRLRDDEGWVDSSYVNHLLVNGGVVACAFDDPSDDEAAAVLEQAYPGREVVRVDARPLFDRGGGIHCITQQQPALPAATAPARA